MLVLDVDDDASVAAAVGELGNRHGAIDVLVNNAGVDHTGPVETTDLDLAREVMETNFWGPVRTIRAALPAMREKGGGVIVNVSSVVSQLPGTPYGAGTRRASTPSTPLPTLCTSSWTGSVSGW